MKDKEEIDKIYHQIKNYLLSSTQIIKIFNNNIIDYNWIEDEFFIISTDFINKWKSLIHFNEIYNELKRINKIDKIDDKMEKNIIMNKIVNLNFNSNNTKNLSFEELNFSIFKDKKDSMNLYIDCELISKNAYESFIEEENDRNSGKVSIKKGIKKIIIKIKDRFYIILYINNQNRNIINEKDIKPFEQELNKLIIEIIDETNEDLLNKYIDLIIREDIYNWLDEIKFDNSLDKKQYSYKGVNFFLSKKREPMFSINQSYINKNESQISKSRNISLVRDINYINTILVAKIKNTSYIISSMYSLSQIAEFAQYFYAKNINFNHCSKIIIYFQDYMNQLLKKNDTNEIFEPKDFMKFLRDKDNKIFNFKEEKVPIVFIKKLFKYINVELNNKDKDIENYLINFIGNFNDKEKFIQFYNREFMKRYNSIVSKIFYGIFQENCTSCGEYFKKFKYIDLNITEYSNYQSELDNSLVFYYLDDLIEFYFNNENKSNNCKRCKNKRVDKKIIKFPDIIIFNINWGQFSKDNGFNYKDKLNEEKELLLEQNKFIFGEIIDLTNYNLNQVEKKKIKYKVRSIINYPIINDSNRNDKSWKKYITFNRHFVDNRLYSFQPSGTVDEIHNLNRIKFVPCVLFYEKIK